MTQEAMRSKLNILLKLLEKSLEQVQQCPILLNKDHLESNF